MWTPGRAYGAKSRLCARTSPVADVAMGRLSVSAISRLEAVPWWMYRAKRQMVVLRDFHVDTGTDASLYGQATDTQPARARNCISASGSACAPDFSGRNMPNLHGALRPSVIGACLPQSDVMGRCLLRQSVLLREAWGHPGPTSRCRRVRSRGLILKNSRKIPLSQAILEAFFSICFY